MLADDWCTEVITPGVDCSKPGIYKWDIDGAGVYVGRFTSIDRPRKEYRRNIERILDGASSHHRNGRFRRIHHALADAVKNRRRITLTILANAEPADLDRREREFIRSEGATLNRQTKVWPPQYRRPFPAMDYFSPIHPLGSIERV